MRLGLGRRIGFTLGALVVYCIGTYIPVPGIDQAALDQLFRCQPHAVLTMFSGDFGCTVLDIVRRSAVTGL